MKMETIKLDSVDKYNKLFGLPTLHPLAAVVDLKQSTKRLGHARMTYGLYALFLKTGCIALSGMGASHMITRKGRL